MKTLFTSLIIILSLSFSFSQNINGVELSEIKETSKYIKVSFTYMGLKKDGYAISIDYGQQRNFKGFHKDSRLQDDRGLEILFNSEIDGLNYMYNQGYELKESVNEIYEQFDKVKSSASYILKRD